MSAGQAALFAATLLLLLGVLALVRRYQRAQDVFDTVTSAAAPEWAVDLPTLVVLPDGFTCLRCEENPAVPDRIWCAVCAPVIDALPAEPIDHGGLDGSIARHPAGKQLRSGEDR